MVVFGQKLLYSDKSRCIRANSLLSGKVVVLGQSGCSRAKFVVFVQKWLNSDKSYSILAKWLYSGKRGCIRSKW